MGLLEMLVPRRRNASLENPSVSLQDVEAWNEMFGSEKSVTGVRVTAKNAIGLSPLWRGINLIAGVVGRLPFSVFKELEKNKVEPAKEHPAYFLSRRRPNQFMTSGVLRKSLQYHALLCGNGYAAIFRNGHGDPTEELLLDPRTTKPIQTSRGLIYETIIGGTKEYLKARDVFHLKGLSYDGLVGHDVLSVMADTFSMALAGKTLGGKYFANGAHVGGFLQIPKGLSEKAEKTVKEEFKVKQSGLDNAFRVALLEDGVKFIQTTIDPAKVQLLESRRWDIVEIANVLGLPPHKLGDGSRAAYNSLEQENKSTLEDAYDPWLCAWEEEANDKLLTEDQLRSESHFFEFDRRRLQAVDEETRMKVSTGFVNGGLLLADQALAELNLPPLPNGEGQKLRIPSTVTIAGEEPATAPPAPVDPAAADNTNRLNATRHALRCAVQSQLDHFGRIAADEALKGATKPGNYLDWTEKRFAALETRLCEALTPVFVAISALESTDNPQKQAEKQAKMWSEKAKNAVISATNVKPDRLSASLEELFSTPEKWYFDANFDAKTA